MLADRQFGITAATHGHRYLRVDHAIAMTAARHGYRYISRDATSDCDLRRRKVTLR